MPDSPPRHDDDPFAPDPVAGSRAWRQVADALIAGIRHELNGRLSSLSSVVQIARMRETGGAELLERLEAELTPLSDATRLLHAFPAYRRSAPGPVSVASLLEEVVVVARKHRSLESVEYPTSVSAALEPVRGETGSLRRSLLVLLSLAARSAVRHGGRAVTVEAEATGDGVRITLAAEAGEAPSAPDTADLASPPPAGATGEALREALAASGGRLERAGAWPGEEDAGDGEPLRFVVELPASRDDRAG